MCEDFDDYQDCKESYFEGMQASKRPTEDEASSAFTKCVQFGDVTTKLNNLIDEIKDAESSEATCTKIKDCKI